MILWIIFIVVIILLFFFIKKTKEGMSQIPANLFQTWESKNLPPNMKACVARLKRQNPEFNHYLYDDDDCRTFIEKHFDSTVLDSFDNLIPGAYKADLWRYCVLYIKGGIYLDIKYECYKDFKLSELLKKTHYVLDRKEYAQPGSLLVYNGCIVSPAKNPVLKKCIDQIVMNVINRDYGYNPLYPTGPGLLGEVVGKDLDIDLIYSSDTKYIIWKKKKILKIYPEYRAEQKEAQNENHYHILWKQGLIYQP
jgi:mannosyltransferase OCH1-like enzyme